MHHRNRYERAKQKKRSAVITSHFIYLVAMSLAVVRYSASTTSPPVSTTSTGTSGCSHRLSRAARVPALAGKRWIWGGGGMRTNDKPLLFFPVVFFFQTGGRDTLVRSIINALVHYSIVFTSTYPAMIIVVARRRPPPPPHLPANTPVRLVGSLAPSFVRSFVRKTGQERLK